MKEKLLRMPSSGNEVNIKVGLNPEATNFVYIWSS